MNIFAYLCTRALGDFVAEALWVASVRAMLGPGRLTVCYRDDRPYKRAIAAAIHNATDWHILAPNDPAPPLDVFDLSHGKTETGNAFLDDRNTRDAQLVLTGSMFREPMLNAMPLTTLRPPTEILAAARNYLAQLGLDTSRWYAVVYWKEEGYPLRKPNIERTIYDPAPYLAVIEHILDAGGQVVRIGHPTPTAVPARPGLLDLAKLPGSEALQFVAVAMARFMVASGSGPQAYGPALGIPTASVDMVHCTGAWRATDYMLTQGFEVGGVVYRQREALAHGLLNPTAGPPSVLRRNTAAELIAATDEMLTLTRGYVPWSVPKIPEPERVPLTFPVPVGTSHHLLVPPSERGARLQVAS